jgi:hypothetical protein
MQTQAGQSFRDTVVIRAYFKQFMHAVVSLFDVDHLKVFDCILNCGLAALQGQFRVMSHSVLNKLETKLLPYMSTLPLL